MKSNLSEILAYATHETHGSLYLGFMPFEGFSIPAIEYDDEHGATTFSFLHDAAKEFKGVCKALGIKTVYVTDGLKAALDTEAADYDGYVRDMEEMDAIAAKAIAEAVA